MSKSKIINLVNEFKAVLIKAAEELEEQPQVQEEKKAEVVVDDSTQKYLLDDGETTLIVDKDGNISFDKEGMTVEPGKTYVLADNRTIIADSEGKFKEFGEDVKDEHPAVEAPLEMASEDPADEPGQVDEPGNPDQGTENDLAVLTAEVSDLKDKVAAFEAKTEALEASLAELRAMVESMQKASEEGILELKKQIPTVAPNGRIVEIEDKLSKNELIKRNFN